MSFTPEARGHLHPITQYTRRILEIWRSFGYDIHQGPELETTKFNFDDLNVPADHPARDVQDTFFIADHPELVLRTHSSTVQLRWPRSHNQQPPYKVVEIGKVFRHEATDATHESMFFQCDGVLIDRQVTMAQLVSTLTAFIQRLYPDKQSRIRPSFFPFVEPGIELDVWWEQPGKPGKWLEILGAGLVHPRVMTNMGFDPQHWQGFAFGMGLDRLAMLEYGVTDIRQFYNGNLEFLKQF
jgi:phenylalanyl-tRNA synthetase alpha chain